MRTLESLVSERDERLSKAVKVRDDGLEVARKKFEEAKATFDRQTEYFTKFYDSMVLCAERDFAKGKAVLDHHAANPPKEYISRAKARRINLHDDPEYVEALRAAKKENPDLDVAAFWAKWQKDHPVVKVKPTAESKKKARVVGPKIAPTNQPTPSNTKPETPSVSSDSDSESDDDDWSSIDEAELKAAKERQKAQLSAPAPVSPPEPVVLPSATEQPEKKDDASSVSSSETEDDEEEVQAWLAAQAAARAEKARLAKEREKMWLEEEEKAAAEFEAKAAEAVKRQEHTQKMINAAFYTPPVYEPPPQPRIISSTKKIPKAVATR